MRIFFSVYNDTSLRNYESAVRLLAERGHAVYLAMHSNTKMGESEPLNVRLARELPSVSTSRAPTPKDDHWHRLAMWLRACRDYLQFLDPAYNDSYRARAEERVPDLFRRLADRSFMSSRAGRWVLQATLAGTQRALPHSTAIARYIARQRPDVALFTPYIGLRTVQPDYLIAARALGIRSAVCILSWDNLSSKSLIRPVPDLITVWNETQRREAVELHGVPAERVAVTGAQCYDQWFDWWARPRDEFLSRVGLDPHRQFILYTCFAPFKGAASEVEFVTRWIERVRTESDERLAQAGILVRPHPKRGAQWEDVDLSSFDNVVIWPREGRAVIDEESKADFYDSIFHSSAVVGLNTSAMIEAGIVGRRVHTLIAPEFRESQEGTLHFRYLMKVGGGLVRVAHSFNEHLAQLSQALRFDGEGDQENRAFVEEFVRPHGIDRSATSILVETVERLGERGPTPSIVTPLWLRPLRPVLSVAARRALAAHVRERSARLDQELRQPPVELADTSASRR